MSKKSGYGIRIRDEQRGSYFRELRSNFLGFEILKFFDADPGFGMEKNSYLKSGTEKIRIRDKLLGSATLVLTLGGDSGVREAIQRSGRREEGIRVHQRHPALIQGSNSDQPATGFLGFAWANWLCPKNFGEKNSLLLKLKCLSSFLTGAK